MCINATESYCFIFPFHKLQIWGKNPSILYILPAELLTVCIAPNWCVPVTQSHIEIGGGASVSLTVAKLTRVQWILDIGYGLLLRVSWWSAPTLGDVTLSTLEERRNYDKILTVYDLCGNKDNCYLQVDNAKRINQQEDFSAATGTECLNWL